MLNGRFFVTTDDIKAVAHPVLRHRVITNFNAESSGVTPDKVVDRLAGRRARAAAGRRDRAGTQTRIWKLTETNHEDSKIAKGERQDRQQNINRFTLVSLRIL